MPKISLELTKKQRKEMYGGVPMPGPREGEGPTYPYGTEIQFMDDHARSLNLADMKAGDVVAVRGSAKVSRISATDAPGKQALTVSLQFTEVEVYPPAAPPTEGEMFEETAGRDYA